MSDARDHPPTSSADDAARAEQGQRLGTLIQDLASCMAADRRGFAGRLRGLQQRLRRGQPITGSLRELEAAMSGSEARLQRRRAHHPRPVFSDELPINTRRYDIEEALQRHQVIVVCGETGSGKTTQIPKICLAAGRGQEALIGHTQPRRIAARSVAMRIAQELGSELGREVGYKVRFSDQVSDATRVKVMTDGILLAETQSDRLFEQYDTLIIDEAHERSLNIDFLLGYLKLLLPRRPDLRIVITSATIDPERFSRHFDGAPIILVSGRTYAVEVRYRPLVGDMPAGNANVGSKGQGRERDQTTAIVAAVDELSSLPPGDILVFLAGEREIRETSEALRKHHPPHTEILPLYARLSATEQNRVFDSHTGRRIVLATNVAETSLTVPGIRYVIDPGRARISRYSIQSKVQQLPVEPISRASADQRKGRCGRLSDGVCIRLYDQADFGVRPAFTEPEILRTNLASVILQMEVLGLGEVAAFPFVDLPERRQINDGYRLLEELGAVDSAREVTATGRQMARLPVDPRFARMIVAAQQHGCLAEILVIVAGLSINDPRERPLDVQQAADEQHRRFQNERSDFVGLLKLWDYLQELRRHLSTNKLRRRCQAEFLSWVRLREWQDIHRQLTEQVTAVGARVNLEPVDYAPLHKALLSGLIGHVGLKDERGGYQGVRNRRFHVFPGSSLARRGPKWVMAAELVETARLFARTAARIEPEWVEEVAASLLRRSHSNPRWSKRAGGVVVDEQVSLYGLVLVARRRVSFARIDPRAAREIFLREALVAGDYGPKAAFLEHNLALVEGVEELEAKVRRRDILVAPETLFGFYDARIPSQVCDERSFEPWRRRAERAEPRLLHFTRAGLMRHGATAVSPEHYPDRLSFTGMRLPVAYRFEPGEPDDGVTLTVPVAALGQLDEEPCEWLVPGLLRAEMLALIRGLPKSLRRNFVPAPEFAQVCFAAVNHGQGRLTDAMTQVLRKVTGVEVPASVWSAVELPEHLRMNFKVVDADGRVLAEGRDLAVLRERLQDSTREGLASLAPRGLERDGLTAWPDCDISRVVEISHGAVSVLAYPGLVDRRNTVSLVLFDAAEQAERAHRSGVRRLCMLRAAVDVKGLRANLPGLDAMCLRYASVGMCQDLREDLLLAAADRAFLGLTTGAELVPRNRDSFEAAVARGKRNLHATAGKLCRQVGEALERYHVVARRLKGTIPLALAPAYADLRSQLDQLVYRGFVTRTPEQALEAYPRYLQAAAVRLDKLAQDPQRDRRQALQVEPLWQAYLSRCKTLGEAAQWNSELTRYRWLLEEYRVSLFAQHLGTAEPVSAKRLGAQWARVA